jgi:hypothetical protein
MTDKHEVVLLKSDKPVDLYLMQRNIGDYALAGISPLVQYAGLCGGEWGALLMVVRISRVEPVAYPPNPDLKRQPQRFRIVFDEYALLQDTARVWAKGRRNPVAYTTFAEIEQAHGVVVNPQDLQWHRVGESSSKGESTQDALGDGIDIPTAKRLIALRMGIQPEQVEISIRA